MIPSLIRHLKETEIFFETCSLFKIESLVFITSAR
jgi:hypothetical protein